MGFEQVKNEEKKTLFIYLLHTREDRNENLTGKYVIRFENLHTFGK